MKALFEDESFKLIIGREGDKITIESVNSEDDVKRSTKMYLPLSEAIKLETFIGKMNGEIEDEQEGAKSFWRRKLI